MNSFRRLNMRIGIFSYSMTGNNDALAEGLASALGAEHFRVEEKKPRTNGRIFFDLICNRTPPVQLPAAKPEGFDLVVFVAPVWVGQVATPSAPASRSSPRRSARTRSYPSAEVPTVRIQSSPRSLKSAWRRNRRRSSICTSRTSFRSSPSPGARTPRPTASPRTRCGSSRARPSRSSASPCP
jgi:hypothetical protein